jgi:hypothetical protein
MHITEVTQSRIEAIITKRLQHSTNFVDVYNWLGNFEETEVSIALDLLEKFEFFSVARIVQIFNEGIQHLYQQHSQKQVIFLGIGEFGKSGSAMAYFLKQTPVFSDKRYKRKLHLAATSFDLLLIIKDHGLKNADFLLILVDDFIGSGGSTIEFLEGTAKIKGLDKFLEENQLAPTLALLSIIVLKDGLKYIKSKYPELIVTGERREKIFSPHGNIFGYRPKMLPIREFCYKYGVRLSVADNALGFENSQALVAFSHTTPNNTIPIIWSSNHAWHPLYPRFGKDKIDQITRFRSESHYWLSIAQNLKISAFSFKNIIPYNELNIQLMTIIRLKAIKRATPLICQYMSITLSEYGIIMDEGKTRGLFTKADELSKFGREVHEEIRKKVAIQRSAQKHFFVSFAETVYLPSTFKGET